MLTQSRKNRLSARSATLVAGLVTLPLVVAFAVEIEETSKTAPKGQQSAGAPGAPPRSRDRRGGYPLADVRVASLPFPPRICESSMPARITSNWKPDPTPKATTGWRFPGSRSARRSRSMRSSPGYRSLRGTVDGRRRAEAVEVVPGTQAEAALILKPALYFAGIVVDEQGKPIPG